MQGVANANASTAQSIEASVGAMRVAASLAHAKKPEDQDDDAVMEMLLSGLH